MPILSVRDLRIERHDGKDIVSEVSFDVGAGEILAIVGESGCGKTSTALALLGQTRSGTRIAGGTVLLDGEDMLRLDPAKLRQACGARIAYLPQDPGASLNPRHRIGEQIGEALSVHGVSSHGISDRVAELLRQVGLPDDVAFCRRYSFELSGGQQQRVAIAMALACRPRVVVLDEPTTGLDVTTQARILELLVEIATTTEVAYIYVTHDLAVVNRIANRIAVMYAGRIVESGPSAKLLYAPTHPYTAMLVASVPRLHQRTALTGIAGTAPAPSARPEGCFFAPRCPLADLRCSKEFPPVSELDATQKVRCWHAGDFHPGAVAGLGAIEPVEDSNRTPMLRVAGLSAGYGRAKALRSVIHDINFDLFKGECLALVGESGSGKSTIGRCIAGLHAPSAGRIAYLGNPLAAHAIGRQPAQLKAVQIVFQNPERSLNPRETVGDAIMRPIRHFRLAVPGQAGGMVSRALERVRLPASMLGRYPNELSGGEKQRVAIARALAAEPSLMICDEITSALDVSTQAAIVNLLAELREEGLTLLFITHNLALVRAIADRVLVLQSGLVREVGRVAEVIDAPVNQYTRELLAAAPDLDDDVAIRVGDDEARASI